MFIIVSVIFIMICILFVDLGKLSILNTKRNAMFLFAFLGVKIIDFKFFFSAVLPCYKDLDCRVPS